MEATGINRYMLGCKSDKTGHAAYRHCELIDTCWDVNLLDRYNSQLVENELIDTCWDVNSAWLPEELTRMRELIDTCWDVNQEIDVTTTEEYKELIDTCWDVNIDNIAEALASIPN